MTKISKNIKKIRTEKQLSQEELAQKLFISRQAISSWENGRTQPDIEMVQKLAEVLEVPVEALLYGAKRNTTLEKGVDTKNNLSILFSVLGSLFLGCGVIIVLMSYWNYLPTILKTVVAFLPMLLGQATAVFVHLKKSDSDIWKEGASVVWSVGIISTIGLTSVAGSLYWSIPACLIIDAVFMLFVMMFFKTITPLPFYYIFAVLGSLMIITGNIYSDKINLFCFLSAIPLLFFGFFMVRKNRKSYRDSQYIIAIWVSVIALIVWIALSLHFVLKLDYLSVLGAIFVSLYCLSEKESRENPFYPLGVSGSAVFSILAALRCFVQPLKSFYGSIELLKTTDFLIPLALSSGILIFGFIKGKNTFKKDKLKLVFCALGAFCTLVSQLHIFSDIALFAGIICVFTAFLEGLTLSFKGAKEKSYYSMNTGIILLVTIMLFALVYVNIRLFVIGALFFFCGGVLLTSNIFINKQIKAEKNSLESEAYDE